MYAAGAISFFFISMNHNSTYRYVLFLYIWRLCNPWRHIVNCNFKNLNSHLASTFIYWVYAAIPTFFDDLYISIWTYLKKSLGIIFGIIDAIFLRVGRVSFVGVETCPQTGFHHQSVDQKSENANTFVLLKPFDKAAFGPMEPIKIGQTTGLGTISHLRRIV